MQATIIAPRTLEDRLEDGARLLFEQEQRGDTGETYQRYLKLWLDLLDQYRVRGV